MVLVYALAIAASGLLTRGGGPGTVLVRTGHVWALWDPEGLQLYSCKCSYGTGHSHRMVTAARVQSTTPTHLVQCTAWTAAPNCPICSADAFCESSAADP